MDVRECLRAYSGFFLDASDLFEELPSRDYSKVVRAWQEGGLLTPEWSSDGNLKRVWVNVIAHQVAVARIGFKISSLFPSLSQDSVFRIVEASLVHDSFKRREQEIRDAAKKRCEDISVANHFAELESIKFLEKIGFSPEVAFLASKTGDLGLERMLSGGATLKEKIVFYADCCVSNDQIVGYKKRFDDLKPHFLPGGRYEYGNQAYLAKYGKTHREMWDSVVIPLEQELNALLGLSSAPEDLYKLAL